MENNKIYIITLTESIAYDLHTYNHFATTDKNYAYKWAEKFNKLIDDTIDRIGNLLSSGKYINTDSECSFHEWVYYNNPSAMVEVIELR